MAQPELANGSFESGAVLLFVSPPILAEVHPPEIRPLTEYAAA